MVNESTRNAGDVGSIPGSGISPGEGNGNPFFLEKSPGQRSQVAYSSWGHKRPNLHLDLDLQNLLLSHSDSFVTPWTVAHLAPL